MTVPHTLADIRTKVRLLTARTSMTQISDSTIDGYINSFYLYDLPEVFKILKLDDIYTFYTQPNIEVYPFPSSDYTIVSPPAYVGGQQIEYFQDDDMFYRVWPKINYIQTVATGNGTPGPYSGTLVGAPFLRSVNVGSAIGQSINVLFAGDSGPSSALTATDDGNGGFEAPASGTIDYAVTGNFTITFASSIQAGAAINAATIPYAAAMPRSILFFSQNFYFRPIPDQSYIVQINVERVPTQLINATDSPELNEWWELLAFGAARKILVDNGDYNNLQAIQPYYEEKLILANRRTIREGSSQRSPSIYDSMGSWGYSNQYPYI